MEKSNNSTFVIFIFEISKFRNIGLLHLVVPIIDLYPITWSETLGETFGAKESRKASRWESRIGFSSRVVFLRGHRESLSQLFTYLFNAPPKTVQQSQLTRRKQFPIDL